MSEVLNYSSISTVFDRALVSTILLGVMPTDGEYNIHKKCSLPFVRQRELLLGVDGGVEILNFRMYNSDLALVD
jgi:hypothetical protein